MRSKDELVRDIKIGYAIAGVASAAFVALVVLCRLGGGEAAFRERLGFSSSVAVSIYVIGGAIDGLIIGLMRPLARTWIGTFLIAYCVGVPLLVMIELRWRRSSTV